MFKAVSTVVLWEFFKVNLKPGKGSVYYNSDFCRCLGNLDD